MTEQSRVVTSAVPSMSVAAVRRALSFMRRRWESNQHRGQREDREDPLYLTELLPSDIVAREVSLQEFSLLFVQGHHAKRCRKRGQSIEGFWMQEDVPASSAP
jgi:hypothetical protein